MGNGRKGAESADRSGWRPRSSRIRLQVANARILVGAFARRGDRENDLRGARGGEFLVFMMRSAREANLEVNCVT